MNSQPYLSRPGMDERMVVREMIRDRRSEHWKECSKFVNRCVYAKANNIPTNLQEDIIQEVMYKAVKNLPYFRFQCSLKIWLNMIAENCIIDAYRKLQNKATYQSPLVIDPLHESDYEDEELNIGEEKSAEETFETNDEIRNGIMALLEYANTHSNPIRDRLILRMVLFEGQTHAEAAKAAECHAPVVGYVVREAQRYARKKMGHA